MTPPPKSTKRKPSLAISKPSTKSFQVFSSLAPAKPTRVYDTYWKFAAERQNVFFSKIECAPKPWTKDPILAEYKFTNAYRASDRVSQFLINEVIYKGDQGIYEVLFRILLFKTFNKIQTWKALERNLGPIKYTSFNPVEYGKFLSDLMAQKNTIYSAAYIMTSGRSSFGHAKKHKNHLDLISKMMKGAFPEQLTKAKSMRQVFDLLLNFPTIGDFLGYQYATDINYSSLTSFSEMDCVVPGPGAKDGIRKCFESLGGLSESDIIKLVVDRQEVEFERLGIKFRSLWGRRLQLIDCQNLFCEVDKYSRVAHPEFSGVSGRTRIKQKYRSDSEIIFYQYPPKWGINDLIKKSQRGK